MSLLRIVSVLALAIAACTSSSTHPLGDVVGAPGLPGGGGGGGDDGGTGACGLAATPAPFALPTLAGAPSLPFAELANTLACTTGTNKLVYSLTELNGDGAADLVFTSVCDDATIGATAWLVYFGTSGGFATTATRFLLPPASATNTACAKTALVDADGDLRPDWVVTSLCNDVTVGTSRWLVYANGGTGFAQTATPYELPPGATSGAFATTSTTAAQCANGAGIPAFAFFDLTGDRLPDFVMTQACDDAAVGTTSWRVFAGGASGASQTAVAYALPSTPIFTSGAFASLGGVEACGGGASKPTFTLFDFDADGKLDIVATQICLDTTVGSMRWLYYKNGGTGFAATPATLSLPAIPGASPGVFAALSADAGCGATPSQPGYSLADGNGDGLLDLLVFRDCGDSLTGATYWQLFVNDGTGFAATSRHLTLPLALGATTASPAGFTSALQCTAPVRPQYVTTYLPLAIIETSACADATVGLSRWLLYSASCN